MSDERTLQRLRDIIDAIEQIDLLLLGHGAESLTSDRRLKAAFERFLEIVSEASRHVPMELKRASPLISWRRIADIGNHLRHAYQHIDAQILWDIHAGGELARLGETVNGFITTLGLSENKKISN